jgi:hypothetical protein
MALAINAQFPELDASWPLLRDALVEQGFDPHVVPWSDPGGDWSDYKLVLVNYTWGYVTQRHNFLAWAEQIPAPTLVVNPLPLLEWNSDKRYLSDLADDGLPVVPTTWVPPGANWGPPCEDYVIKPSVASGGLGAARYVRSGIEAATAHVRRLHADGYTVMVQPYQPLIDESGETALVFIDGRYSHAVHKQALLQADVGEVDGLWDREVISATEPRDDQKSVAEGALRAIRARFVCPAYARVDLVDGRDGHPLVLEVELVEPSLFLPVDGVAATQLARCLRQLTD